jgi:hypothetical protein
MKVEYEDIQEDTKITLDASHGPARVDRSFVIGQRPKAVFAEGTEEPTENVRKLDKNAI